MEYKPYMMTTKKVLGMSDAFSLASTSLGLWMVEWSSDNDVASPLSKCFLIINLTIVAVVNELLH